MALWPTLGSTHVRLLLQLLDLAHLGFLNVCARLFMRQVAEGTKVTKGQPLAIFSAMKMETVVAAPMPGTIKCVGIACFIHFSSPACTTRCADPSGCVLVREPSQSCSMCFLVLRCALAGR